MSSIYNKNYVQVTYSESKTDYPNKLCKYILDHYGLNTNQKLLDIGCGDATFTKSFIDLGFDAYGLDISESGKDNIKDKLVISDLVHKPYPFDDESFDVIFSKSVVEHLRDPDILIDEAYRLLKPNGIFICLTPSWKHTYKEAFYIDHTHYTPFTRLSLETACILSGFEAKCDTFYQLPLIWKYPILSIGRVFLNLLNLPYRPISRIGWADNVNKIIRFSKEAMLLCVARKN